MALNWILEVTIPFLMTDGLMMSSKQSFWKEADAACDGLVTLVCLIDDPRGYQPK